MKTIYSRQLAVFFSLLFFVVVLIFLSNRGALNPVKSLGAQLPRPVVFVFGRVENSVLSFLSYFSSVSRVAEENARLNEKTLNLQKENVVLQQYKLENEKLKKELSFREGSDLNLISATVIGRDAANLSQVITVNAGSADGVKKGATVLAQGTFVGRVSDVATLTSQVLLITDPQSSVDAQISKTGDNGIVRGSYGSGAVLDMLSQNAKISKGDEVVTLGLSSGIPRGLLIGTVGEFQSDKNDILQKATVIPGVDLKNLYFVSVVK